MKILLDSCIAKFVRDALLQAGHQVDWCNDWPSDPGDQAILLHAFETGSVLVTLDKDFGELAIVRGLPHRGIVRLAGLGVKQQAPALLEVIRRHGTSLEQEAIITVTSDRLRIRSTLPGTN